MLDAAMLDKIGGLAEGARTELADKVLLSCVDAPVFHQRVRPPEPLRTALAAVALLALVQGAYVQAQPVPVSIDFATQMTHMLSVHSGR